MKTIHFFGCSHTAGHELPDAELFPWKKDCKTVDEYYDKFKSLQLAEDYMVLCKSLAYPNIIENTNSDWRCVNHADFGSSLKQEIFKAVTLIENNNEPLDFLVFQIPIFTREMALTNSQKLKSFSLNFPITGGDKFNAYLEKTIMFHSINHWSFHGQLDLLMFQGYLRSKNIKHIFVDLELVINLSVERLQDVWKLKTAEVYDLQECLNSRPRLLAGHYDIVCHNNLAKKIADTIKETI